MGYYFYNLIFLNFLYPCVANSAAFAEVKDCAVNGSLWTIKFELLFYFLLPFFYRFASALPKKACLFLSSLLLFLLGFASSVYLQILVCFCVGVLLSISKEFWLPGIANFRIPSQCRVLLVFVVAISSGHFLPLSIASVALLIACFIGTKDPSRDLNFLRFGDLSFGMYLVHFPILQVLILVGFPLFVPKWSFALILTLLSCSSAALLFRYVEKRYLLKGSHYAPSSGQ